MKDMEKDFESDIDRVMNTVCVVVLALAVAFFGLLAWHSHRQPIRERAAYLQGYYGIDADTAWEMALQGHGKTAEEVSQGK